MDAGSRGDDGEQGRGYRRPPWPDLDWTWGGDAEIPEPPHPAHRSGANAGWSPTNRATDGYRPRRGPEPADGRGTTGRRPGRFADATGRWRTAGWEAELTIGRPVPEDGGDPGRGEARRPRWSRRRISGFRWAGIGAVRTGFRRRRGTVRPRRVPRIGVGGAGPCIWCGRPVAGRAGSPGSGWVSHPRCGRRAQRRHAVGAIRFGAVVVRGQVPWRHLAAAGRYVLTAVGDAVAWHIRDGWAAVDGARQAGRRYVAATRGGTGEGIGEGIGAPVDHRPWAAWDEGRRSGDDTRWPCSAAYPAVHPTEEGE